MGSMSYCRFRNTLEELRACNDALYNMNDPFSELSEEEAQAFKRLVKLCREIADDYFEGQE